MRKKFVVITEESVSSIRPGCGLHPKYLKDIFGKTVKNDLEKVERCERGNI